MRAAKLLWLSRKQFYRYVEFWDLLPYIEECRKGPRWLARARELLK